MDQALVGIFSITFVVFALVVAMAVMTIRALLEAAFQKLRFIIPDWSEKYIVDFWREWVLRGLPLIVGAVFALSFGAYPYPEMFAASNSGRVFFGLIAGLFSSSVYSLAKFHIKKYLPEDIKKKIDSINPVSTNTEDSN